MTPTGYKDKNGKDIYVGDIVKFRSNDFRMSGKGKVIKHNQFGYLIQDIRTEYECKRRNVGRLYTMDNYLEYEIISELKGVSDANNKTD